MSEGSQFLTLLTMFVAFCMICGWMYGIEERGKETVRLLRRISEHLRRNNLTPEERAQEDAKNKVIRDSNLKWWKFWAWNDF
jgi:hypothetical protein